MADRWPARSPSFAARWRAGEPLGAAQGRGGYGTKPPRLILMSSKNTVKP